MKSNGDFTGDYEVFLSFRGKDTRQGFTDILYEYMTMANIRVFRDDDELAIGDKIESILEAIDSSKICIPVFSKNFAESKWCLREVARMVELKKMIVPVLYKVSTDDVKLKETSVYVDDFMKLQQNHRDPVEIDKWKNALREAVSHKGRKLGDKSYTKFCKELVNEVLSKLGPRARLDVHHFVGETNKAEVLKLLDMGSSSQEAIYLGIYGMGGIGKTTLTKLIYNEFLSSFEYCGFLPDIREFSADKGVNGLPSYLYENIQPKSLQPLIQSEDIPNLFRNKKVLIILDDVDSDEQIKKIAREPSWFGSGSRIILTSRDKKVFKDFELESGCDIQYLEMKELQRAWSLELFSICAFGISVPPSSYQSLSMRAVAYAGGLPLAITVIAKYLRNQKEVIWEEIIERLEKTPPKEVKTRLMISYDSLDDEQKEIFLDIACIFNHSPYSERSHIFYMWQACGLYPHWSLEILQSRMLVKLVKNTLLDCFDFQMHDLLRDMGRDIVISKSGNNLMKQSRLWKRNEMLEVLKCNKEQKNAMVEALGLDIVFLSDKEFVGFDNLRYLGLSYGSKLIGDFSNLFPKLIWLRLQCRDVREIRYLAPSNLVILDLSGSNADENWDGWSQLQMFKKLKVLDLHRCQCLQRTPLFPENMALERLDLNNCMSLKYIGISIGKLQHLTELNLSGCRKLKNLPESCGELHALQRLTLELLTPASLPESIGRLEKLEELLLSSAQVEKLPELPSSLKELSLECHGLSCGVPVPDLSKLQHLTSLKVQCARYNLFGFSEPYPNIGLSSMFRLLALTLIDCEGITDIPVIGELRSLTSLTIEQSLSIVSLVNLDKLVELRTLCISGCPVLVGIPGVGKLRNLTELKVEDCDSLELLGDISGLEKLEQLHLIDCPKLTEITGLVNLRSLGSLNVEGCRSTEILGVATQLKILHGVEVFGMPNCYADNIDDDDYGIQSQLWGMDDPHFPGWRLNSRINEPENLATYQLENLLTEVEANSTDDMQQIRHLGVLTTDQGELDEDIPGRKTKNNWCCWKFSVQDTQTQPK